MSSDLIEQTINRDQKRAGGIINFCTMEDAMPRWVLTSHIAAKCKSKMELFLGLTEIHSITKDVSKEGMALDEECVVRSYELVKQWGSPFTENGELVHLSSGIEGNDEIRDDMVNAQKKEEEAMNAFIRDQIESNETDMHYSISKMKLKTFANQKAKLSYKISDKTLTLKADREIFARFLVIGEKREVNMKDVLTYSLGPIPWALATPDGGLVKTEKSKLLKVIECDCADPLVSTLPHNCARIFDGMVLIQLLVSTKLKTFAKIC